MILRPALVLLSLPMLCACGSSPEEPGFADGAVMDGGEDALSCEAMACAELECGSVEMCGSILECGVCPEGSICQTGQCVRETCAPRSCDDANQRCGEIEDGCGGMLTCGAPCAAPEGACEIREEGENTLLSQHTITWTVEGTGHATGHFLTGDCWIVGPVRVIAVSPSPDASSHGSMMDPETGPDASSQAYEAGAQAYRDEHAVSFPVDISGVHSLISSRTDPDHDGAETHAGWVLDQAILTVLESPAGPRDFRPAYAAGAKRRFSDEGLDLSFMPTVAAIADAPPREELIRATARPWVDHVHEWVARTSHAVNNMPGYGADITATVGAACLGATLEGPGDETRTLALQLVQLGIDFFGLIEAGQYYPPNGGHHSGRLLPILFAGRALNVDAMLNVTQRDFPIAHGFAENCQTYGDGEYGIRHCNRGDDSSGYISVNSPTWVGLSLCARMMGLRDAWDHEPFFAFVARWAEDNLGDRYNGYDRFSADMWRSYSTDY